jgi:diguanylate cyclase (GGDEF)-like protein
MAKERTEYRHRTAALTDALTGIANRRGFLEQSASSKRWMMDTRPTAVMLFDVDRFKLVNDHSGHAVGDQVLLTFANTAKAHVGAAGLVGRWGGDEFAAVIYDTSREAAVALAEQIRGAFERAVNDLDACQVQATVSTGIVFSAAGPLDLPALLVQADQALYRAKEQGRNRIAVAASDPQWDRDGDGRVVPIESRRRKTASAA